MEVGVERPVKAGIPVIVGTGAVNTASAVAHAAHAAKVGAAGPWSFRGFCRGATSSSPRRRTSAILAAARRCRRSSTTALLRLRHPRRPVLRAAGRASEPDRLQASSAATTISPMPRAHHPQDPDVTLMIGVDTAVSHGYVNCGATGAITGIGCVLPRRSSTSARSAGPCPWRRHRPASGEGTRRRAAGAREGRRRPRSGALLQMMVLKGNLSTRCTSTRPTCSPEPEGLHREPARARRPGTRTGEAGRRPEVRRLILSRRTAPARPRIARKRPGTASIFVVFLKMRSVDFVA